MLPPVVIFKGKTARSIADVINKNGAIVMYQDKAWMDEDTMKVSQGCGYNTQRNDHHCLYSTASVHISLTKSRLCLPTVIVIPGGCNSVLQPLDVSINRPFKDHIRKCWQQYMVKQSDLIEVQTRKFNHQANGTWWTG